jgi:hypothetical protein
MCKKVSKRLGFLKFEEIRYCLVMYEGAGPSEYELTRGGPTI